jgi:catechol 2,3-dioxygenase-like lactoylglutathione lyase family enzyme
LRVDDLDAVHAWLVEAGVRMRSGPVRLTEEGAWHDVRVLYATDPDGTWIELVERPEPAVTILHEDEDEPLRIEEP